MRSPVGEGDQTRRPALLEREIRNAIGSGKATAVFPELALTFYTFIKKLHIELLTHDVPDVFFMSREGQPLLHMFDMYSVGNRSAGARGPKSHYLEVSRRSTFLPSLGNLKGENFETLFRQYRAISLVEFWSSLSLDDHIGQLCVELDISKDEASKRLADLPTDPLFHALVTNPRFQRIYEEERTVRRNAFIDYVRSLCGGKIPKRIAIVDVGWKGTIQDNVFNMLCKGEDAPATGVVGYYLGLVAEGAAGKNNEKHGLVFSCCGGRTRNFNVFNENRALFEVMLAADHGSIVSYNEAGPIRGPFAEEVMVKEKIMPALKPIFSGFSNLIRLKALQGLSVDELEKLSSKFHKRLVFHPTPFELNWFTSVFHVENYGFFENSLFVSGSNAPNVLDKLKFCINFIKKKGKVELGFWPYKTIFESGGTVIAKAYKYARCAQRG